MNGSDRPGFNQIIDKHGNSRYVPNTFMFKDCVFENCVPPFDTRLKEKEGLWAKLKKLFRGKQ